MNKNSQTHFTTGEFAKLFNITKHTLFHYDQMGIFSPAIKGENGYRYYSMAQVEVFYVISALKELDMPLKEIKEYLDRRSPAELAALMEREEALLDRKIERLREMKEMIHKKAELARRVMEADLDGIRLEPEPEQKLVLTKVRPLTSERNVAISFTEHLHYCTEHQIRSPYLIGSMIGLDKVEKGDFENYSYFYTRVEDPPEDVPVFVRKAGLYLSACHQGGYDMVDQSYRRVLEYARENQIGLRGSFFEDVLLDELSVKGYENYVLRLSILTGGWDGSGA